jgi:1-deoxy-D-xylulose-5-phosphate synthase
VRYPRGAGIGAAQPAGLEPLPYGRGEWTRKGRGVAILAFGTLLHPALAAADRLGASVANMRWAKPLDLELLRELAHTHDALVTLEEGCIQGGAGSAVLEALQADGLNLPGLQLGLSMLGLDAGGIERSVRNRFAAFLDAAPGLKAVG